MSTVTIDQLSQLYEMQHESRLRSIRVEHEPFRRFSLDLEKLIKALDVNRNPDVGFVTQSLRILKRYRFDICAAPLNFAHASVISTHVLQTLHANAKEFLVSHSIYHRAFSEIVVALEALVEADTNPLFAKIITLSGSGFNTAVLLKEARHISTFGHILKAEDLDARMSVISQHQLRRSSQCYDKLLIVGPVSWFSDFVLRVARARETYVVNYSWLAGRVSRPKPALEGWERLRHKYAKSYAGRVFDYGQPQVISPTEWEVEEIPAESVAPKIDLQQIIAEASQWSDTATDAQLLVAGRLCQLEGGTGVFIEARDGATSLVIDLEEQDTSKVKRVVAADLRPGVFLIVRSDESNETDFIVPLANRILGARASGLRKFQAMWKESLRRAVVRHGMSTVIKMLTSRGSIRASEVNVGNWMSERSIRTEDPRDFNAIMDLIGCRDEAEKCWRLSSEIDRAHRRAGRMVRKELMRLVMNIDLIDLERFGKMRFELGQLGARPLLAIRVVEVSEGNTLIPQSRMHKVFDLPETV